MRNQFLQQPQKIILIAMSLFTLTWSENLLKVLNNQSKARFKGLNEPIINPQNGCLTDSKQVKLQMHLLANVRVQYTQILEQTKWRKILLIQKRKITERKKVILSRSQIYADLMLTLQFNQVRENLHNILLKYSEFATSRERGWGGTSPGAGSKATKHANLNFS